MKHKIMSSVAGAGKTTALKREIEKYPNQSILFITFNKSLEEESKVLEEQFSNVSVTTFHGLVYRLIKGVVGDFKPISDYLPNHLMEMNLPFIKNFKDANLYINLLNDFFHSKKSLKRFIGFVIRNEKYRKVLGRPSDEKIRGLADVWEYILDNNLFTHDAYCKLFQLKKPKLNAEIIMVDEYQDFSESMINAIENAKNDSKIILAGDANQRIYEWRGASGEFNLEFEEQENLHSSWRCPQEIIDIANPYTRFLSSIDMNSNKKESGVVITHSNEDSAIDNLPKEPIMFLTRTNSYAYVLAEKLITKGFQVDMKSNVSFEGIEYHWYWLHGYSVPGYLSGFVPDDKEKLLSFYRDTAQEEKIQQLNCALEIENLPYLKESIEQVSDSHLPIAVITTVYKAKGLGFENVFIAKDFKSPFEIEDSKIITDEDLKLLYVAITRSKKTLRVHEKYVSSTPLLEISPKYTYVKKEEWETMLDKKIREMFLYKEEMKKRYKHGKK